MPALDFDQAVELMDCKWLRTSYGPTQSRRASCLGMAVAKAHRLAFEARLSDLLGTTSGSALRLEAANRLLEPDFRPMLEPRDEQFAQEVVNRARPKGSGSVSSVDGRKVRSSGRKSAAR